MQHQSSQYALQTSHLYEYLNTIFEENETNLFTINAIYQKEVGYLMLTHKNLFFISTTNGYQLKFKCSILDAEGWAITKTGQFISSRYDKDREVFIGEQQDIENFAQNLKKIELEDYTIQLKKQDFYKNVFFIPAILMLVYLASLLFLNGSLNPFEWWDYNEIIKGVI